jgi:hypothetical protein
MVDLEDCCLNAMVVPLCAIEASASAWRKVGAFRLFTAREIEAPNLALVSFSLENA